MVDRKKYKEKEKSGSKKKRTSGLHSSEREIVETWKGRRERGRLFGSFRGRIVTTHKVS